MDKEKKLDFTGERFTPECVREIWYEHYHRYAFACHLVKNKTVLDAACGEGYGSNILATEAKNVTGLDIDFESINHATSRYNKENLSFVQGSCTELPFEAQSFDVIVSFETLEHLKEQSQMLSEFKRVLKSDGLLIISTPDKKHYSDATGFTNEYHLKELYKEEFEILLGDYWKNAIWYSQAMAFHSILEKHNSSKTSYKTDVLTEEQFDTQKDIIKPMYYVVVAGDNLRGLSLPDIHMFADIQQSVYEHYNKTIRDYIYLANKHNDLLKEHEKLFSIPILGRVFRYINKRK